MTIKNRVAVAITAFAVAGAVALPGAAFAAAAPASQPHQSAADTALSALQTRQASAAVSPAVEHKTLSKTGTARCLGVAAGDRVSFTDHVTSGLTSGGVVGNSSDVWTGTKPFRAKTNRLTDTLTVQGVLVGWNGLGGWHIISDSLNYSRTIKNSFTQSVSYSPKYTGFLTDYKHSSTARFTFASATCNASASGTLLF